MDNNSLAIYVHELRNLLFSIQGSFNLFNGAIQQRQTGTILYGAQLVLSPVGQLSALLWPPRARSRARGEKLRKILQLGDKHALNDRRLTELGERFDEKLDEWVNTTRGNRVIIDYVGDLAQLGEGVEAGNIYRAYDMNTRVFYFRGVGYNMQSIADAVTDLSGRINAVYRQMFPEQAAAEDEYRRQLAEQIKQQQEAQAKAADEAAEAPKADAATEEAKPAEEAKAKKPAAKKAPAKKAAAKKPAEKKPAAKKTTAKKAPAKKAATKKDSDKKADA